MRFILLIFACAALAAAAPVQAQTFLITATGTASGNGDESAVPAGTRYTFTETFHVATATLTSSSAGSATYSDPDGTSSLSFGGLTVTGTAPLLQIVSGDVVDNTPIYGFDFSQSLSGSAGYAVQLISIDSLVAPSTSLSSLGSLQTANISDFETSLTQTGYIDSNGGGIGGKTTSYLVQVEAVPEPTTLVLVALAVPLLFGLHRLRQKMNGTI